MTISHAAAISGPAARSLKALVLAAGLSLMPSAHAASSDTNPAYQCHRVAVLAPDGMPISGIEDPAVDQRRQRLILSAYDRLAVQDALRRDEDPPQGNLYVTDIASLVNGAPNEIEARVLVTRGMEDVILHPHGIGLYDDGEIQRLAVVNRLADRHDHSAADLLLLEFMGDGLVLAGRAQGDTYCRANDVTLIGPDTAIFTFDQTRCGAWGVWLERIVQPRRSGLRLTRFGQDGQVETKTLVSDAAFANGVALDKTTDTLLMTASRDGQIRHYPLEDLLSGETDFAAVEVDGGPDNISVTGQGDVSLTAHPVPFDLFLYMNGLGELPGSRVLLRRAGQDDFIMIDPDAEVLPGAATSAAFLGERVVVSSAWDAGLGLCVPDVLQADGDRK